MTETSYLIRLAELQEDAAKLLFYSLPENGWTTCTLDYREAGPVSEIWVVVTDDHGDTEPIEPSFALNSALRKLRNYMSTHDSVWLSAVLRIENGRYAYDYNYVDRPNWRLAPPDDAYVDDLKRFPRPADQIPEWYPRNIP